jgi:hypothetical protein
MSSASSPVLASGGAGGPAAAPAAAPAADPVMIAVTRDGILSFYTEADASAFLRGLNPEGKRVIAIDLHGTVDLVDRAKPLVVKDRDDFYFLGLSWVGSEHRDAARIEFEARVESGQLDVGIMVFNRASRKASKAEKNTFTEVGSKAWTLAQLKGFPALFFLDDGADHVASVKHQFAESTVVTSLLFSGKTGDDVINRVNDWARRK